MPYTKFTTAQVAYLRAYYAEQPPTHFAQRWGIDPNKVYDLARRHGIKRRAPNGQPVWRGKVKAWTEANRWA